MLLLHLLLAKLVVLGPHVFGEGHPAGTRDLAWHFTHTPAVMAEAKVGLVHLGHLGHHLQLEDVTVCNKQDISVCKSINSGFPALKMHKIFWEIRIRPIYGIYIVLSCIGKDYNWNKHSEKYKSPTPLP